MQRLDSATLNLNCIPSDINEPETSFSCLQTEAHVKKELHLTNLETFSACYLWNSMLSQSISKGYQT